jgi:hypothetical protein
MKTQVRNAVFETNSSSSHSVTVRGEELADFGLSREELRSGIIRIEQVNGFHRNETRYADTKSKIAYLLITAAGGEIDGAPEDDLIPGLRNSIRPNNVIEYVEEATGCRLEFYVRGDDGYVSVEHQAHDPVGDLIDYPDSGLGQFLFSAGSYVETGYDY